MAVGVEVLVGGVRVGFGVGGGLAAALGGVDGDGAYAARRSGPVLFCRAAESEKQALALAVLPPPLDAVAYRRVAGAGGVAGGRLLFFAVVGAAG